MPQQQPKDQNQKNHKHSGDQISGNIGENSKNIVIGKNIIQIGTIRISRKILLIILLSIITGFGVIVFNLNPSGPPTMRGAFNVAVAQFGEEDENKKIKESEIGKDISYWIFKILKENKVPGAVIEFWQDSLPKSERGVNIGFISGESEEDQEKEAEKKAEKINAHLLIYGNINKNSEIVSKFLISNIFKGPDSLLGSFVLGHSIKIDKKNPGIKQTEVTGRITLLFWFVKALASLNEQKYTNAIEYFQNASNKWEDLVEQAKEQGEQKGEEENKGREIVYFFLGQSHLFPANWDKDKKSFRNHIELARKAFNNSLKINPHYIRSQVGLGSVYILQAYRRLEEDNCNDRKCAQEVIKNFVDPAINEYLKAINLSKNSQTDIKWNQGAIPLGLGIAYDLKGQANFFSGNFKEANIFYDQAIAQLKTSLKSLIKGQESLLLGQTYLALGNVYSQKADILPQSAKQEKEKALGYYRSCQELTSKDSEPVNKILTERVIPMCKKYATL
jgi:tetratricopeptide (TPR) repeat protein